MPTLFTQARVPGVSQVNNLHLKAFAEVEGTHLNMGLRAGKPSPRQTPDPWEAVLTSRRTPIAYPLGEGAFLVRAQDSASLARAQLAMSDLVVQQGWGTVEADVRQTDKEAPGWNTLTLSAEEAAWGITVEGQEFQGVSPVALASAGLYAAFRVLHATPPEQILTYGVYPRSMHAF